MDGEKKPCVILLTENWTCLLVGIEPKDRTKPKSRRKDLFLAASKEDNRDISQSGVSPNSKVGAETKRIQHILGKG